LLGVMSKLCGKTGMRDLAGPMYEPAFSAGLADTGDAVVREAAAQGLVNVNKPQALRIFKERKLAEDSSLGVRRIMIILAGDVGDVDELNWLAERLGANGEAEAAWTSMSAILQRQGSTVILNWVELLKGNAAHAAKVTELLSLAETRLQAEKNAEQLRAVRIELLNRYLSTGDTVRAVGVFSRRLIEQKDLEANDSFVEVIREYLDSELVAADNKISLINAFGALIPPTGASWPKWLAQLKTWQKQFLPVTPGTPAPVAPLEQPATTPSTPASTTPDKPAASGTGPRPSY
jgi:hypothetical protein